MQAVKDLRAAYRRRKRFPDSEKAEADIREISAFFCSQYFEVLTDLDGGRRLGRFIGRYREAYFRPSGMNPYTGVVYGYEPLPGAEERICEKISDIAVSMKALDYLDMPEYVPVTHTVRMDARERKIYDGMKKELLVTVEGEEIDAANAAALSGKLLQMANGAVYGEDGRAVEIHDRKLLMQEDLVEQVNGQSVLVAYWFRHDHERIAEHLRKKGYAPRDIRSEADIADWNAGRIQVGLISPAGAGHGLNIQKEGRHVKATDVDHIVPHRGDPKLFWDRSNWQVLCHRCHSRKTRREDQTPVYHY